MVSIVRILVAASSLHLLLLTSAASAQPQTQTQFSVSGGQAGPGDTEGWAPYLSAAVEGTSWTGLTFGGDAAVVLGRTGYRPGHPNGERYAQFIGSVFGGLYLLQPRLEDGARVQPFVTAGLSLVTDPDCCGPAVAWNAGAGAVVWVNDRVGVRLDGRLIRAVAGEGGMLTIGAGLAFRRPKL